MALVYMALVYTALVCIALVYMAFVYMALVYNSTHVCMYVYLLCHNYKKAKQVQSLKNSKITNKGWQTSKHQSSALLLKSIRPQIEMTRPTAQ